MDVETSSSPSLPTEKALVNVHLFNCDRIYKLESVEKLLRDVEANAKCEFSISKHYFPLPMMAETCVELAEYQMDFAVFVVHANESILSINEERTGIGYAKIYRALLRATGNRVLIVIGGDEYYEGEEDIQVLSRWAKLKIRSQFSPEYLDGRKSFVFSWDTKHRLIHEDAVLHFLDPQKQGELFVPEVRSAPEPDQLKTEIPEPEVNVGDAETPQSSKISDFQIAVLGYKVQQSSFDAAKTFVQAVGDNLHLTLPLVGTNLESVKGLKTKFLALPELSLSKLFILVVEKATVTNKDESPFLDLLTELEKYNSHQTVVIASKDRDWEAGQNMLMSQSVKEHATQFKQHSDNWIVYSWNEDDENFNTENHEDDLVKKTRNWFEAQRLKAKTRNTEVVNRATTESQIVSPDAEFEKADHSDCPTYRCGGGLLRMTVRLEHGEIKEAVQKFPKNWEPPPELIIGIKKLFHDTPFIDKAEIWEEEDGSHSIQKGGTATKITRFVKEVFRASAKNVFF